MTASPSYLAPMAAGDVCGTTTEEALQEVDRIAPALPRVSVQSNQSPVKIDIAQLLEAMKARRIARPNKRQQMRSGLENDPNGLEHDPARAFALANQQQVATVGLSNVAQVAARDWDPHCAPWCGLPYGDKRVPSHKSEVHFASRPFTLRSPAYCCPQTPPDAAGNTAPVAKEDDRFEQVLLAMRADPEFVGPTANTEPARHPGFHYDWMRGACVVFLAIANTVAALWTIGWLR